MAVCPPTPCWRSLLLVIPLMMAKGVSATTYCHFSLTDSSGFDLNLYFTTVTNALYGNTVGFPPAGQYWVTGFTSNSTINGSPVNADTYGGGNFGNIFQAFQYITELPFGIFTNTAPYLRYQMYSSDGNYTMPLAISVNTSGSYIQYHIYPPGVPADTIEAGDPGYPDNFAVLTIMSPNSYFVTPLYNSQAAFSCNDVPDFIQTPADPGYYPAIYNGPYAYIGCYRDVKPGPGEHVHISAPGQPETYPSRAMTNVTYSPKMSIAMCEYLASAGQYYYFGLQAQQECWLFGTYEGEVAAYIAEPQTGQYKYDNFPLRYGLTASPADCNRSCDAGFGGECGGYYAIAMYMAMYTTIGQGIYLGDN